MSELLAIFGPADADAELLAEIVIAKHDRVTVLLEDADPDWASDESPGGHAIRDRLAQLLAAIESWTGATVVGLAGHRAQLAGQRFDHELSSRAPVPA